MLSLLQYLLLRFPDALILHLCLPLVLRVRLNLDPKFLHSILVNLLVGLQLNQLLRQSRIFNHLHLCLQLELRLLFLLLLLKRQISDDLVLDLRTAIRNVRQFALDKVRVALNLILLYLLDKVQVVPSLKLLPSQFLFFCDILFSLNTPVKVLVLHQFFLLNFLKVIMESVDSSVHSLHHELPLGAVREVAARLNTSLMLVVR